MLLLQQGTMSFWSVTFVYMLTKPLMAVLTRQLILDNRFQLVDALATSIYVNITSTGLDVSFFSTIQTMDS